MTELSTLRRSLTEIPEPRLPTFESAVEDAIADSVRYLGSDAALRSIDADVYWPKWSSPWWHMLLLHELGEARRIPERIATKMTEGLQAFPIKTFPIWPEELAAAKSPHREIICHCALGCMVQVLRACGRDVDRDLPWIKPWFARYQMADGGLNCDETAYRQRDETPSSMVGTVAPFEAMLLDDPRGWTPEQAAFIERAAGFLIARQLMLGSQTRHNAGERQSQVAWLQPCFPRFYLYDVVRGISALVRWAEVTGGSLPLRAIGAVAEHLVASCPDGIIRLQRQSYLGVNTWIQSPSGDWVRQPTLRSALLEATSAIGRACPVSTRQWSEARRGIVRLIDGERITGA